MKPAETGIKRFMPDEYTRRARIYPFLLVALPVGLVIMAISPGGFLGWGPLVALITWAGGTALIAQFGRDLGKRKERLLFANWGGKPTVRMLRHRDCPNRIACQDIHRRLQAVLSNVQLPTVDEEAANPRAADEVYEYYGQFIRTHTRDKARFPLISEENCNYGFRRNLWGMKPVGVTLAAAGDLACGLHVIITAVGGEAAVAGTAYAGLALNLLLTTAWLLIIKPAWVRIPADAYAERLLEASMHIDTAEGPPSK